MLDIRAIRQDPEAIEAALKRRDGSLSLAELLETDRQYRELLQEEERLRAERNRLTNEIARISREKGDASTLKEETRAVAERVKALGAEKDALEARQNEWLLTLPNAPLPEVPDGPDESHNKVLYTWGDEFKNRPCADPLPHWEMGTKLGWIDFERAVKVAQSRFSLFTGTGARLVRRLIDTMLTLHVDAHGYTELAPPLLVNHIAMQGTGQLPKFEADLFACRDDDLFLIPTAEVPVTNLHAGEILEADALPISYVAYTPCFRREAGSAGRDTRGLIRQHQFDKVELVHLCRPEASYKLHEALRAHAEAVLQKFELPYRVVELCAGDLGFSAARCYDLEVWMPAQGVYREISSCSNFLDFQARRIGLKYKNPDTKKNEFIHTLNGSGVAVGRTFAALLENYQIRQGEVALPEWLLAS